MADRYFVLFILAFLGIGVATGSYLSTSSVTLSRFTNLLGLSYSILGLCVVSELLVKDKKIIRFCIDYLAPGVLWLQTAVPLGMAIGNSIFSWYNGSTNTESNLGGYLWSMFFASLLPLSVLDYLVVNPTTRRPSEVAWRIFGFLLIMAGQVLQFIAAIFA